jgi:uncharacterized protein (TIGR02453 family)
LRYTAVVTPLTHPCFTPRTLTFLRGLKKHNDRSWFAARKEEYERDVRAPMAALVERLAVDLRRFAPDLVATPRASLYRIYRDTRFTEDKSPFKTQVGAIFPHRDFPKHQGAGLYLEIGPAGTMIVGGMYMPQPQDLQAVRDHLAGNFTRFRALVESPGFRRTVGPVTGDSLRRVPRGYSPDHPAADYLRMKQFLFGRDYPAAFATDKKFYREVLSQFERMAPVVHFLNEALSARVARRDPLQGDGLK